jgi:hypothetical protein
MIESLLLHLLIGLIVFGCIFAVVRLVLPNIGLPEWAAQAAYIVLCCLFLVWLIYLLLPLVRSSAM